MVRKEQKNTAFRDQNSADSESEELRLLSREVLQILNCGLTRTYFLRKILRLLSNYFKADEITMLLMVFDDPTRSEFVQYNKRTFTYNFLPRNNNIEPEIYVSSELPEFWKQILSVNAETSLPFVTDKGSYWIRDLNSLKSKKFTSKQHRIAGYLDKLDHRSILLTPFLMENERIGFLEMKSHREDFLRDFVISSIETFIHTLGITLLNQYTQAALQERVKELTCLYNMSQIADKPHVSREDLIYSIMDLLPPAWQYPEITRSRITLDGIDYSLPGFQADASKLSTDIITNGDKRGKIEIIYTEKRPELDEGPFLKEERKLLDAIANELAMIIIRRESEDEKVKLVNKLHHADRLATVGELAAGVAHELNEPLGSILGFAQLAGKYPKIPGQVAKDLEKIVKASLHAREIIKKLMVYSRHRTTEKKKKINLNQIIEESLYFFKSRCQKEGISLELSLAPNIPELSADPVQINQVLINIVVNAMQAMPNGGVLHIETAYSGNRVMILIKDTGVGMTDEVLQQIFDPFFTTKQSDNGVGLGLSVVDGIIKSQHGKIEAESEPGRGTEFRVILPTESILEEQSGE
jgi:signal transduction histidine kinase